MFPDLEGIEQLLDHVPILVGKPLYLPEMVGKNDKFG